MLQYWCYWIIPIPLVCYYQQSAIRILSPKGCRLSGHIPRQCSYFPTKTVMLRGLWEVGTSEDTEYQSPNARSESGTSNRAGKLCVHLAFNGGNGVVYRWDCRGCLY